MIELIFTRSPLPFGLLIRWGTRSAWSHVAAVSPDGSRVLGAKFFQGVCWEPIEAARHWQTKIGHATLPAADEDSFWGFLEAQIGKPYDKLAIIGIGLADRHWAREDAWICSELIAAAAMAAGTPVQAEEPCMLTPRDLWISPEITDRSEE